MPPEDLRKLLESFRQAQEAAKTVDDLTGQKDCVDPDKAQLLERVERLEKELAKLKKAPKRKAKRKPKKK